MGLGLGGEWSRACVESGAWDWDWVVSGLVRVWSLAHGTGTGW